MAQSIVPKQGWKTGASFFASLAVFVLLVNIVMIILAARSHRSNEADGSFPIYEGNCTRVGII